MLGGRERARGAWLERSCCRQTRLVTARPPKLRGLSVPVPVWARVTINMDKCIDRIECVAGRMAALADSVGQVRMRAERNSALVNQMPASAAVQRPALDMLQAG